MKNKYNLNELASIIKNNFKLVENSQDCKTRYSSLYQFNFLKASLQYDKDEGFIGIYVSRVDYGTGMHIDKNGTLKTFCDNENICSKSFDELINKLKVKDELEKNLKINAGAKTKRIKL